MNILRIALTHKLLITVRIGQQFTRNAFENVTNKLLETVLKDVLRFVDSVCFMKVVTKVT